MTNAKNSQTNNCLYIFCTPIFDNYDFNFVLKHTFRTITFRFPTLEQLKNVSKRTVFKELVVHSVGIPSEERFLVEAHGGWHSNSRLAVVLQNTGKWQR